VTLSPANQTSFADGNKVILLATIYTDFQNFKGAHIRDKAVKIVIPLSNRLKNELAKSKKRFTAKVTRVQTSKLVVWVSA